MKKYFKYIFLFIFTLFLLAICNTVKANSINKISMDILINNNGDAYVTEVWNCNTNSGTEVYHPYYNLGKSEIINLRVKEGSSTYTTLSSWSTSASFDKKAYKCGIHKVSGGVELCWGISSYGDHSYTVSYTITNFVASLTDAQMVYWTLIPHNFSNSIGRVYIKIHTNFNISDSVGVWGFGDYGAPAYVYNGYIEMESNGRLNTNEYMTILIKFPENTFNSNYNIDHNFDYYLEMAEKGSTKYNNNKNLFIKYFLFISISTIILFTFIYFIIKFSSKRKINKFQQNIDFTKSGEYILNNINLGKNGRYISKNIPYYRDIPCDKDIFRTYFIGNLYGLFRKKTDIFGTLILKWIKDDIVRIEKRPKNSILKKEETIINLLVNNLSSESKTISDFISDPREIRLYDALKVASDNNILENKEFKKWCKHNCFTILNWFDKVIETERDNLIKDGYIVSENVRNLFGSSVQYTATPKLKEEAIKIAGFKRYLIDYSLINEREPIEVKLFEEYLVYAQMMGIAKKVAKNFKNLYPDVIEQSNFNDYNDISFIDRYSSRAISRAYSAISRAEARASSYSSGGGGYSSGGGGGGSFGGGGSGGGGFR